MARGRRPRRKTSAKDVEALLDLLLPCSWSNIATKHTASMIVMRLKKYSEKFRWVRDNMSLFLLTPFCYYGTPFQHAGQVADPGSHIIDRHNTYSPPGTRYNVPSILFSRPYVQPCPCSSKMPRSVAYTHTHTV